MQILAVVVLYKRSLEDSQTIRGLTQAFESQPELQNAISLLVWDNSPAPLVRQGLPFHFEYRHSSQNVGVSGAYNRALAIAEKLSCQWMLLFDQDTTLPRHYLPRMLAYSQQFEGNEEVAAIAPFLLFGRRSMSPGIIRFYGGKALSPPFSGVHLGETYAANSGVLMRVRALREVGGYDEDFWLDHSDMVAFHRLHLLGKRLYVAGDLELPHVLSLMNYDDLMTPERYRNFIHAEGAYWDIYRPNWQNQIQTARLLARSVRQYLRYKNKEFSRITWLYFQSRIFLTKNQRLTRWKQQLTMRDLPAVMG